MGIGNKSRHLNTKLAQLKTKIKASLLSVAEITKQLQSNIFDTNSCD